VEDDVDRTDFSDPSLNPDLDKVRLPTGPHSEVETTSLLVDLINEKVPVDTTSYLLVALSNLGPKMFNVSAASGTLSSEDGKVLQQFAKQQYGDPLGPREQRSVLFGFTPSEETSPGTYKLEFKIFYNNRDNDQFVDTVFNETVELVPKPLSMEATLRVVKFVGGGLMLLLLLPMMFRSRGGKPKAEKAKADAKSTSSGDDEWLAATLAGTENQLKKRKKKL